ncbi:solute carrier family 13 member 5 [Clupea harengus]|uniref:Solute carrier family 13 member 5 n=1 Tax=Clupea harengus TaxID=7950 RepID=A0A8M1KQQ7_CLUHA|nr:solute carrier family 13 member 5 [Clupea harengus]
MAIYWCTECIPLAVTALLPVILFPLMGIMESSEVCVQYLKDSNMLFIGGLLVAIAVENWNLHKRIALRVLLLVGVKPALLMMGFMGTTAFLSMWISNTASTAMMLPIAQAVLAQLQKTEAEADEKEFQSGRANEGFEMDETKEDKGITTGRLLLPGWCVFGMSIGAQSDFLYSPENRSQLSLARQSSSPLRKEKDMLMKCVGKTLFFLRSADLTSEKVAEDGYTRADERRLRREKYYTNLSKGMSLCVCYSASIGGTATLTGTTPNLILKGQMDELFPANGGVINFATWFGFCFPNMVLMLVISWLWLQFMYLGFNLKKSFGCGSKSEGDRAAYQVIKDEYKKLGNMTYAEGNVLLVFVLLVLLWFTREPGFMPGWATVLFNQEKEYVTDGTVAIFMSTLFFVLPSQLPRCFCVGGRSGESKKAPPALLNWEVVHEKMPWNILLLLGGGFALARGSETSGLSLWLGQTLEPLKNVPDFAIAFLICMLIATFTECSSNTATTTLFLPILASMAVAIKLHPLYVMLPSTICASLAFMLPVATPPNAIAFSYGNLKVIDMAKAGIVLNLLGVLCVQFALNTWGVAMFQLKEFPTWANTNSTTSQP